MYGSGFEVNVVFAVYLKAALFSFTWQDWAERHRLRSGWPGQAFESPMLVKGPLPVNVDKCSVQKQLQPCSVPTCQTNEFLKRAWIKVQVRSIDHGVNFIELWWEAEEQVLHRHRCPVRRNIRQVVYHFFLIPVHCLMWPVTSVKINLKPLSN